MPQGKELEQLPMSNVGAPSMGDDHTKMNRTSLKGGGVPKNSFDNDQSSRARE